MSTSTDTGGNSSAAPKGRAKACTACRQVKLRCDAKELAPAPCTRCRAQGLECRMDASFKRVPARRQLEEMSKRLNNLQKSLGLEKNPNFSSPGSLEDYMRHSSRPDDVKRTLAQPRHLGLIGGIISESSSVPEDHPSPGSYGFLNLDNKDEQGSWTLGDVTLEATTVRILFKHFEETHWRHIPILEPCKSLHKYYESSELLFWTVAMVSCFLFNEYDDIHYKLLQHHRQLLSLKMMGERVSLKTIHAMLLMCCWTYPVSSQYDDLTWLLSGAAVSMSLMMGFHKPGHMHEYDHSLQRHGGSPYTRNITFLACFITSTGISSWLGMPPPLCAASHLETIALLCKDTSIPREYRARADVQRQVVQVINSLDSKMDFRTRFSLIKIHEQEFDRVQAEYDDVWNDDLEIEWLGAKLYLFGIAFVTHGPSSNSIETESPVIAAREVLQKGLAAAVGILDTISHMKLPHTHRNENRLDIPDYVYQLGFYPKQFFRVGAFATFFLLWFLAVDAQASESDKELARTYITFTYRLMLAFKHSPEHFRAGKSIEQLARMPISSGKPSTLRVNTRLGASFMYSYTLDGQSEANPAIRRLPTLGVDTVGDEGPVHPKVDLPQRSTEQSKAASDASEIRTPAQAQSSASSVPEATPPADQVFSNAFFQDNSMLNFDFPWGEWDPAAFNGLESMDVDLSQISRGDGNSSDLNYSLRPEEAKQTY